MFGPILDRELAVAPRRASFYLTRVAYAGALLLLICTAWLVLAGAQVIRNVGDIAEFGGVMFRILAPLQIAAAIFFAALTAAASVAQEKDRQTLVLLLLTEMSGVELVIGKMASALSQVFAMLLAGLPVLALLPLFGGVDYWQVARVFFVVLAAALAAGSMGTILGFWRDNSFQALALTSVALVIWLGLGELIAAIGPWLGSADVALAIAELVSPTRAVLAAAAPVPAEEITGPWTLLAPGSGFALGCLALSGGLLGIAVAFVRVWNPSQAARVAGLRDADEDEGAETAESARQTHVDAARTRPPAPYRGAWQNPVLWRETQTWAYGRWVIAVRLIYVVVALLAAVGLHWVAASGTAAPEGPGVPEASKALVPLLFVSLVLVNALAVTSMTSERDARALDLLLSTDLSAQEIVLGKLGGVLWMSKEMVLLPVALCCYLWFLGGITLENLIYVVVGLAGLNVFVAVLGLHCGLTYANSRTAVSVSLGSVFMLFLGVISGMLLMVSFSGSFQGQLLPFAAIILGGGLGLFVALGARNPSSAIFVASMLLPLATFYAMTSYLLGYTLGVMLVLLAAYGFATAAMLAPALSELNVAPDREEAAE